MQTQILSTCYTSLYVRFISRDVRNIYPSMMMVYMDRSAQREEDYITREALVVFHFDDIHVASMEYITKDGAIFLRILYSHEL